MPPGSLASRSCARSVPTCARPMSISRRSSRRLSTLDPATPIGVALLDQRVAAGIGNVYKSETLWACGVDPFASMDAIAPDIRRELYTTASRQLRANLDSPFERRTVARGPRRLRPGRTSLPALRHRDRVPPSGRPGAQHLVVPRLPDLSTMELAATGRTWAVATPHRLATDAAAIAFERGGNAIDAALAAATTLAVVYPHMCGVGGDLFALVQHPAGDVVALNASGRAPAGADPAAAAVDGMEASCPSTDPTR